MGQSPQLAFKKMGRGRAQWRQPLWNCGATQNHMQDSKNTQKKKEEVGKANFQESGLSRSSVLLLLFKWCTLWKDH